MLVVEKYLSVVGGHEHSQLKAIDYLAPARKKVFVTGMDYDANDSDMLVHSVLSTRRDHRKCPDWSVKHDAAVLTGLLDEQSSDTHCPVLFPNAQTHDIRVCLALLHEQSVGARIYLRILVKQELANLFEQELASFRRAVLSGEVKVVTETASMTAYLKEHHNLPSSDSLLLPCSIFPNNQEVPGLAEVDGKQVFKVGYLGGFRDEKGCNLIPQILSHLNSHLAANTNSIIIEFVMQKPDVRLKMRNLLYEWRLRRSLNWPLPNKKLQLAALPLGMAPGEFQKTLRSCDLILVPYSSNSYSQRGSGIILDGVMAEKPIVYTNGIGMSELLRFGNGEESSEHPDAYAQAIIEVLCNLERYRQPTKKAAEALNLKLQESAGFLAEI